MNRKASTLFNMAISIVLIALGVGLIYSHNMNFWPTNDRWAMGHHGMIGGGMGIIMILMLIRYAGWMS
jgi:hypothetical protein